MIVLKVEFSLVRKIYRRGKNHEALCMLLKSRTDPKFIMMFHDDGILMILVFFGRLVVKEGKC